MRIRRVNRSHYVCCGTQKRAKPNTPTTPSPKLPKKARDFWKACDLHVCDKAVIATDKGKIVALFRYFLSWKTIWAAGTWVAERYRRRGIADRLWDVALKPPVNRVQVITASKAGRRFVKSLRQRYPKIRFIVKRLDLL